MKRSKSGTLIGSGSHTYLVDHAWGNTPALEVGYTHGVAVDSADRVYLFNQSPKALLVFSPEGEIEAAWGEQYAHGAHGLRLAAIDGSEYLFVTDIEHGRVAKHTLGGELVLEVETPDRADIYGDGTRFRPTDVAVAPDGSFFVADGYGAHWVHCYSNEGVLQHSFGGKGSVAGRLHQPHGIWVDERSETPVLYVADRMNERIQVFTLDADLVRIVDEGIGFICGFDCHGHELFVPDLHSRVTVLDENDGVVLHLGRDSDLWQRDGWPRRPTSDCPDGSFVAPHALSVDSQGDVYVVEWVPHGRLSKLWRQ